MKYFSRHIEPKLKELLETFPSVAITGPRQSGKSTLLINTLPQYAYLSLDDPLIRERAISDPGFFLDTAGTRVIVDEIQLAPQLLTYVKMRIDARREAKGSYIFTGSQQFTLIKNLGDSLAGRIALLELLPFSVQEKAPATSHVSMLDEFVNACLRGSYPGLVTDPALDASAWYGAYIQTYLERDIRSIYNVGNLRDFQRFLQLLAGRCGQVLNLSGFAVDIGASVPTIKSWLSMLEACRIIYLLPPYYNNLGKRVTKAPKIYFLDSGLVCYLTGIKDQDHALKGPMAGALFENFCVQETIKLYMNNGLRPQLYYLRTNNNLEVDLIIEEAYQQLTPIEIKLSKTPSPAMGSNIARLRKTFSGLSIKKGLILSLVDTSAPLNKEITAISFDDYLKAVSRMIAS